MTIHPSELLQACPVCRLKESFSHAGFVKINNSYYPCQVSEFTRIGAKVQLEVLMACLISSPSSSRATVECPGPVP